MNFATMLSGFFFIGMCALRQFGAKAEINVIYDDTEITNVDPNYFDPEKTAAFVRESSSSRNTIFWNLTIIKKLPDSTYIHLKTMSLSMGKYNNPTGIDLRMKFCDLFNEPVVLAPLFRAFGFSDKSCPPEPGFHTLSDYTPPEELFPDTCPENKYLTHFQMIAGKKILFAMDTYFTIQS